MISQLDDFTRGYIEAALWSTSDEDDVPLDYNFSIADIHQTSLRAIIQDASTFQNENRELLRGEDLSRAGHDFWLTRNHHGAGFWDGGYSKDVGDRLTVAAHKYGEVDLYVGDDGRVHLSPLNNPGKWEPDAEDLYDYANNVEGLYVELQRVRTMNRAREAAELIIKTYNDENRNYLDRLYRGDVEDLAEVIYREEVEEDEE